MRIIIHICLDNTWMEQDSEPEGFELNIWPIGTAREIAR